MQNHFKRKTLYYTPGLLSLIVFLLLCLFFLGSSTPEKMYAMEVVVPDKEQLEEFEAFGKKEYEFSTIAFTRDGTKNEEKLKYARKKIHQLLESKSKTKAIHLDFGQSTYGAYVHAINMFKIDEVPLYKLEGDNIWVFAYYYSKKDEEKMRYTPFCGGTRTYPSLTCGTKKIQLEKPSENVLNKNMKVLWPSTLLFLALVGLGIKSI